MLYVEDGWIIFVLEDKLLVKLLSVEGFDFKFKGMLLLGGVESWVCMVDFEIGDFVLCDFDMMDMFVDSFWYFLWFLLLNSDIVVFDLV